MTLSTRSHIVRRAVLGTALAGSLAAGFAPATLRAVDAPPAIAEYVMPEELRGAGREAYLEAVTNAVAAERDRAAEIVEAALKFRFEEIKNSPGLATDIVLAGIPPGATIGEIVSILNAAIGVLNGLPADLSNVSKDVVKAVLASLPPDVAAGVKEQVLDQPSGALRDVLAYIYTAPPEQGDVPPPTPTPTPTPTPQQEEEPTEPEVTPILE